MNRGGLSQGGGGGGHGGKLGDDEFTQGAFVEGPSGQETTSDHEVKRKEDINVHSTQELSLDSLTLSGSTLPTRPGFGTAGKSILLKTNYFRINIDSSKQVFRYHVELESDKKKKKRQDQAETEPEAVGRRVKRRAFDLLFETSDFQSLGAGLATDFGKTIITTKPLDLGVSGRKVHRILYREAEETVPRPNPTTYQFTIKSEGVVPLAELLRYLASTTTDFLEFSQKESAIQALNIIVAATPNQNPNIYQAAQNKFFEFPCDKRQYIDLSGGLIAVRGFYSSIRTSTMRTLLNLNAQCSPFYPAVNMCVLMEKHSRWDPSRWEALEIFIEKLRVKTQYLKVKGIPDVRVKTIVGLSHRFEDRLDPKTGQMQAYGNAKENHGNSQQTEFDCSEFPEEGPISVDRFFHKKHGIKLKKPQAWVLNCGTFSKPVWIPPELCEVLPGQAYRGKLSEVQTTNMLTVAARPPAENARRIVGKGHEVIGIKDQNPILNAFGLNVGKDMLVVAGRILDPPEVIYKNKGSVKTAGASWNMIHKNFAVPGQISNWSFLTLGNAKFPQNYLDQFRHALKGTGMGELAPMKPQGASKPGYHADLPGIEPGSPSNDVSIMNVFRTMMQDKVKFLLVILPSDNAAIYARVKYWADVKAGIHTTCVLEQKLSKGAQYYANIALKINQKLGGVNHLLPEKKLGFLAQKDTMIIGIDVTHPAPKSMEGTPSIAGVVASIDGTYSQWPGSIRCQKSRQEMVEDLDIMVKERLRLWYEKNGGRLPRRILIYRDGVSEGQYKTVLNDELTKIRKACEVYGSNPKPQIAIIIVGKRHHTRFYPINGEGADTSKMGRGNPKSGTVVDRGVVGERLFDFFLQAHSCIQGTAKPAHYVVIHDKMKLGADEIQGITHHLCYLYARATKAVSVCPPAYYADILCERGRCYLHKYLNTRWPPGKVFDPNEVEWYQQGVSASLKNSMFYI